MATTSAPTSIPARPVRRSWLRRGAAIVRSLIAVLAVIVISGSLALLALLIFDPDGSEEFTVGRRPALFNQAFDVDQRAFPDSAYAAVLGVAHNSGGSIEATLEALAFQAEVIEVDVVAIDGTLHSAHAPPLPWVGPRFFRGPTLERIWTVSYRAEAMKLDLKQTDPAYVDLVGDFLVSRPITRDVIVSSRSPAVLTALHERAPGAIYLLSVPDEATFETFQRDTELHGVVEGLTMRHTVVDATKMVWMREHDLLVFAWSVNDIERVNELVQLGVHAITSDNLAILSLLGAPDGDVRTPPRG